MATRALWPAVAATFLIPWIAIADVGETDFSLEID